MLGGERSYAGGELCGDYADKPARKLVVVGTVNGQVEGGEGWSQDRTHCPQRLGWRPLTCLLPTWSTEVCRPEKRVMNHTQGYFQTLTPTVGPVPIPPLVVVVPTHHLSYCFLNFPFTFIFLEWRKTNFVWE